MKATTTTQSEKRQALRKKKAIKALTLVAEVYNEGGKVGMEFTALLSAIRGPDVGSGTISADMLKRATTAVIRERMGLKLGRGLIINETDPLPDHNDIKSANTIGGPHFAEHIENAISALRYFGLQREGE